MYLCVCVIALSLWWDCWLYGSSIHDSKAELLTSSRFFFFILVLTKSWHAIMTFPNPNALRSNNLTLAPESPVQTCEPAKLRILTMTQKYASVCHPKLNKKDKAIYIWIWMKNDMIKELNSDHMIVHDSWLVLFCVISTLFSFSINLSIWVCGFEQIFRHISASCIWVWLDWLWLLVSWSVLWFILTIWASFHLPKDYSGVPLWPWAWTNEWMNVLYLMCSIFHWKTPYCDLPQNNSKQW